MSNLETVQSIYAAFGSGDVPAILERLADDIEWDADSSSNLPLVLPRRGRAEVGEFFAATQAVDFTKFEPTALLEGGDMVVALVDVNFTVKATGKSVEQLDEVHIWRFNSDGKVKNFRHRVDTHAHHLAFGA
jgi:ketosteroid isomerase-like protein